jgi:DNA polymerase-1
MYKAIKTTQELKEYIGAAGIFAFDFETAPDEQWRDEPKAALDPHKSHIVGISFSVAENSAVYCPLTHNVGENIVDSVALWEYLAELFKNPSVTAIAHNLAFESAFLYARGIFPTCKVYDTIASSQLTLKSTTEFRKLSDSGLKTLVPELLGIELPTFAEVTNGRNFDELDPQDTETVRYACSDSDYTLRLYHLWGGWFDKWLPKHRYLVERIESPTAVYCGLMKYNGLLADAELMERKAAEAVTKLSELREQIAFIIGDVNIGANASTAAFKQYLYKDLGLPVLKTTAKFQEAADDETMVLLGEWCEKSCPELAPLFKLIQEYRKWGKLQSTYIDGYKKFINTATGRIHTDLLPLATETGRFAARNPNLQNMPRPTRAGLAGEDVIGVRNFFIAPEGKTLLSLDFSQIELRVGAYYCRDEKMLETYRSGGDIHAQTTSVIYKIPFAEAVNKHADRYKERRTIAKNCNFGVFYGLFANGLRRTLKFKAGLDATAEECEQIIRNLKDGYPGLAKWQDECKKQAYADRYTETKLGRRRYLPKIRSKNWGEQSFAERCALNTPIQGTAADILKLALGRIIAGLPERPWLRPLLQIHDELVFELPTERVSEATAFIKACMEQEPFDGFDVPIIAEAAVGQRFGEMEELQC